MSNQTINKTNLGAGYGRVSTNEQKLSGLSIPTQRKKIKEKAKEEGIELLDIFVDEGRSGTNMNRPGLKSLLAMAERQEISYIIILDTDRLSRRMLDYLGMRKKFRDLGIKLIACNGDVADDTPDEFVTDSIKALFNEYFPRVVQKKTIENVQEKVKRGIFPGPAPLGYINVKNKKPTDKYDQKIIIPDSKTKDKVIKMLELYSTGDYSYEDLTEYGRDVQLYGGRDQKPLSKTTIETIIQNPFYYGVFRWGKKEHIGTHTPLISKGLFDKNQEIREQHNRYANRRRKYFFVLRGLLKCKYCGDKLTAEWHPANNTKNETVGYYHCCKRNSETCPNIYVELSTYEDLVTKELGKYQFTDKFIEIIGKQAERILLENRDMYYQKQSSLVARKREAESRRDTVEEKLARGVISDESYTRLYTQVTDELLEINKDEIKLNQIRFNDAEKIVEVLKLAKNLYGSYKEATPELKKHYLSLFFKEIQVGKGTLENVILTDLFDQIRKLEGFIITSSWGG